MSHIFDALQRSQAEDFSANDSSILTAAELLRRAERQALLQWESETRSKHPIEARPGGLESERAAVGVAAEDLEKQFSIPAKEAPSADTESLFAQFRAIPISPSEASKLVCLTARDSPGAEAFRLLKVRLRNVRKDKPLKKVLITSSTPEEGKSFASANLACTLALGSAEKTLLVGGDLRRPVFSQLFGAALNCGICEYLRSECNLTSSIHRLEDAGIWLLPAGKALGDPLEIIQSPKLAPLMETLAGWFDWIIIDSPPMLPLADTTAWARMADGVLLVTRRGITEKRKLVKGMEAFASDKLIGVLLNSSNGTVDKDYYYYRHLAPNQKQ